MLIVGILIYLSLIHLGHYYIEGVGYATIQDVLSGALSQPSLLVLLLIMKLAATSLTLGSGGSGGIFSPSLYMGATLGGAYGLIVHEIFPWLPISPPAFAVAGMAGMFGGATGAAMTAIVMIFEMTLDYNVIIPMTITVALSYGMRTLLSKESIYTLKLARRGHYMPEALQVNFQQLNRAREVMDTNFLSVPAEMTVKECAQMLPKQGASLWFLVKGPDGTIGVVREEALAVETLHSSLEALTMGQIANRFYVGVDEDTRLFEVMARMRTKGASVALVLSGQGKDPANLVKGVIAKEKIADSLSGAIDLFSD
jgi:CIC family chloride channel protein